MSSDEVSESRRKWVQGTTAGLVASVALPTLAQTGGGAPDAGDTAPRDPRTLYPHAPFPQQQQPWPGLAGRMTPRPDHGERSYRGSGAGSTAARR